MLSWIVDNWQRVLGLMGLHATIALSATVIGLVLAVIAASVAAPRRRLTGFGLVATGIIFTIPSLVMFIFIPMIIGTRILDPINIVIALSIYAFSLIFGGAVEGLRSVDPTVLQAGEAMGVGRLRLFFSVKLPLAVPVIAATTRVAAVSAVSMVSVGALIGIGGLGDLFTEGFQRSYTIPIFWGIILTMALALVFDSVIMLVESLLTPWVRAGKQK